MPLPEKPKLVTMIFKPDGTMELETSGFRGATECHAASKAYEDALGAATSDVTTAEGRLPAVQQHEQARARLENQGG